MDDTTTGATILRAIAGDPRAATLVATAADGSTEPELVVAAALLAPDRTVARRLLDRARALATTRRDRQLVAIADASLDGDVDLVGALARDHLVDHPDALLVSWLAAEGR